MGVEIERKFLVHKEKWEKLVKPEPKQYQQGYILMDGEHTVRIRLDEKIAYLNLKSKGSGFTRKEYEYAVPLADGKEILEEFTKKVVEKKRYCIEYSKHVWEVDVFEGENKGLIVAEIELDSEEEMFDIPDWITTEVTDNKKYTNAALSVHPFSKWV